MPKNNSIPSINPKYLIIPVLIIGAIFYFAPKAEIAGVIIFLLIFIIAFSAGAKAQLDTLRKMKDTPRSTIRGASQGKVEISGYINSKGNNDKLYLKYTLSKKVHGQEKWEQVVSESFNDDYMLIEDQGARCWIHLRFTDYYSKTNKTEHKIDELPNFLKAHRELVIYKNQLADASFFSFEEEWLPTDKKVYAIGHFSSSPSSAPPDYLKTDEKEAWKRIASEAEGIPFGEELKGTSIVNTLLWNHQGNTGTPVIVSVHSEHILRRKIWFKFCLIIFSILILLSLPVIYVLENT